MAVVDNVTIRERDLGPVSTSPLAVNVYGPVKDQILAEVKRQVWRWYNANAERVVLSKKVLWFTLSLKVKNLRAMFEELVGKEPVPL